ncbi:MAG: methyltransferase domain-containing protein [Candidatus Latescibacteria bacterium]|nr:methyltransferase domain-containing protein [Candidatus Latescibacterota bacterium]
MTDERGLHKGYWDSIPSDSVYPTELSKMLLMEDAEAAAREGEADTQEVLALVPPLPANARMVELAAGVGRFTPHMVRLAGSGGLLVAYDFVADFCDKNREQCQQLGLTNVEVRAKDVLHAELPNELDLVFASWIFMYLANDEVHLTLAKIARALRPGGWLVFRESCVKVPVEHVGDWPRFPGEHPCRYRSGQWYSKALRAYGGRTTHDAQALKVWDDPTDPNEQLAWVWQNDG